MLCPNQHAHQRRQNVFYDKLSSLINKVLKHDMLIAVGDFNAKGQKYFSVSMELEI